MFENNSISSNNDSKDKNAKKMSTKEIDKRTKNLASLLVNPDLSKEERTALRNKLRKSSLKENPLTKAEKQEIKDKLKNPHLSKHEEEVIKDEIYEINKGFIYFFVNKYYKSFMTSPLLEDILQCARIGFFVALENYDPDFEIEGVGSSFSFSSYCPSYMKNEIGKFINGEKGLSVHYATHISKVKKAQSILEKRGIPVEQQSPDDLAAISGLSLESVFIAIENMEMSQVKYMDEEENLDQFLGDYSNNPESLYIKKEQKETIAKAIDSLSDIEKDVIYLKYFESKNMKDIDVANYLTRKYNVPFKPEIVKDYKRTALKKLSNNRDLKLIYNRKDTASKMLNSLDYTLSGNSNANRILDAMELQFTCRIDDDDDDHFISAEIKIS